MTVVLSNNLVLLKVPALDLLVLTAREQVWMTIGHCKASHRVDVASQRYFQVSSDQIPELDRPVV